jgi:phosphoribosylanthranilate isomerase
MLNSLKIKVCGMRDAHNIAELATLQPDYMGFIFYPKSKRYFLGLNEIADLNILPKSIQKVGVFVDEKPEIVIKIAEKYNLSILQLHGQESPETCAFFKSKNLQVWKAIAVSTEIDNEALALYQNSVDAFLFDTKSTDHGGTGIAFDWKILKTYTLNTPFMLAGGISADNISDAIECMEGLPAIGLDLNSKFEIQPGLKDIEKLKKVLKKKENTLKFLSSGEGFRVRFNY